MAISINPSVPVVGAQAVGSATDGVVLQPGTVVSAQVQNVLAENLVRIAIANLSLDVLTEVALTPGQNLQLSVSQTQDGVVRLQIVGAGAGAAAGDAVTLAPNLAPNAPVGPAANVAAASDPLTPLERIAVSVATESAATAQQTSLDPDLGGGDIQNAFQKSGLFLEASLASGTAPSGSTPDLKAALIVLRQTLATAAGGVESTAAAGAPASAAKPTIGSPSLVPSQTAEAIGQEIVLQARPLLSNLAAGDPGKLLIAQALLGAGPRAVTAGAALNLLQEAVQQTPGTSGNPAAIIT